MTTLTQADANARHIRRNDYTSCTVAFIDCKKPGSHLKENYSIIGPGVTIRDSIVMGCDYYATDNKDRDQAMEIGAGTVIQGAIIDKNVSLGKNVRIVNESNRQESSLEHPHCVIRDGIPIVIKNASLPDNWDLETNIVE